MILHFWCTGTHWGTHLLVLGSRQVVKFSQFIIHGYLSWVSQYLNNCFSLLATEVQSQPALHIMLHITICSAQSFFLSVLCCDPSSSLLSKMPKHDDK